MINSEGKRFFWEIVPGTRCNLRCETCYAAENARPDRRMLDWNDMKRVEDRAIGMGMTTVEVLGGEPLLYPHLDSFIAHFKNRYPKGFCGVVTNGTLITPEKARILKGAGLDQLTVSLDGTVNEINDLNRGQGSFEKAKAGIDNTLKAGIGVTMAYTVTPFNTRDTRNLFPFANKIGIEAVGIQIMEMVGRAKKTMSGYKFDRVAGLNAIMGAYNGFRPKVYSEVNTRTLFKGLLNRFYNAGLELPAIRCDGGRETFMISSGGDLLPCSQYAYGPNGEVRRPGVNLVGDSPVAVENAINFYGEFNREMVILEGTNFSSCQNCNHQELCAPCPLANSAGVVPECEWVKTEMGNLDRAVRESTVKVLIEPEQTDESNISFRVPTQEKPIVLPMPRVTFDYIVNLGKIREIEKWAETDMVSFWCKLRSHQIISISGMESTN